MSSATDECDDTLGKERCNCKGCEKKCENANFGDELSNVKGDTGENLDSTGAIFQL